MLATEDEKDGEDEDDGLEIIPQELLRKYIMHARRTCKPQLNDLNQDKLGQLYSEMREESMRSGGVPIAVRHIESIIRMSEAHAKMHLREFVRPDDEDVAIQVMVESFIQSQKFAVMRTMRRRFQKYIVHNRDHNTLLMHVLERMVREQHLSQRLQRRAYDSTYEDDDVVEIQLPVADLRAAASELEIHNLNHFFQSNMFQRMFVLDAEERFISRRL